MSEKSAATPPKLPDENRRVIQTLQARMNRAGIEISEEDLAKVVKFMEDFGSNPDVCKAREEFHKELFEFMHVATTDESKAAVAAKWSVIMAHYHEAMNYAVIDEEDHPDEGEPTLRPAQGFGWLHIVMAAVITALVMMLFGIIFPGKPRTVNSADLQAQVVSLQKQVKDLQDATNGFDAACLVKQKEVAEKVSAACSEAWKSRLAGSPKKAPVPESPAPSGNQ